MTDSATETSVLTASHWGIVRAAVREGRIVRVAPFELDRAPSPNLDRLANLPYSPSRIRYPMVREGYLKKGPASRANRGKEKFMRVSWPRRSTSLHPKSAASTGSTARAPSSGGATAGCRRGR